MLNSYFYFKVTRFKRERDTYKQMLDGAHKTMSEMRSGEPIIRNKSGSKNVDEVRLIVCVISNLRSLFTKIVTL